MLYEVITIAGYPSLQGMERDEDKVVLIVAAGRLALGFEQTDNLAGHAVESHRTAQRVPITKELFFHGGSQDTDRLSYNFV